MSQHPVNVYDHFAKPVREALLARGFTEATEPQTQAIPLITAGQNVLLVAPTGTGKTEAAILPVLDALAREQQRAPAIHALYITPLRALNRDLLDRLDFWCKHLDLHLAVRHGDTAAAERLRQTRSPPDLLITTPETLQALLPGWRFRRHLRAVRWVIVDEVHELAEDKRGSQLAVALERLRELTEIDFQRIGLSATIGTPEAVAQFLVGSERQCAIVVVPVARTLRLRILYPVATAADEGLATQLYTFPEVAARLRTIRELLEAHRAALLFTNTRSEAEALASRFRLWDATFPVAVHHSSLAAPTRVTAERDLKAGRLRGVICTSSLELGIDIGALDLVVQYNSPRQVTRLVQRVGRSGHQIGGVAQGVIITQDSDDALEAAVLARRALQENLEPAHLPAEPLDVLAHQLIGLLLHKARWYEEEALTLLRRAQPYRALDAATLRRALRYLHERSPRLAWHAPDHGVFGKAQAAQAAYEYYFANLSTIPDEKQYLVVDAAGAPVGVLDEAFVAEYGEPGTKFVVGGRSWRLERIERERIHVVAEDDPTGAIPSWVGDEIPVAYDVAQEVGTLRRRTEGALRNGRGLEAIAAEFAQEYPTAMEVLARALQEVQAHADARVPVPTDRRLLIEQGPTYTVLHACLGLSVNRTLGRLLADALAQRLGQPVGVQQDPYRIVLRVPVASAELHALLRELAQSDLEGRMRTALTRTGLFRRRFLHVARRLGAVAKGAELSALGLAQLVEALRDTVVYEEAVREVLWRDLDVPRLQQVLASYRDGQLETADWEGAEPSPLAALALREFGGRAEVVPPQRWRKLVLETTRARLLSEARVVVCTACWQYVAQQRIADLVQGLRCPACEQTRLGLTEEREEVVQVLARRLRAHATLPARLARLQRRVITTAELLAHHGFAGAVALVARGLRHADVRTLLGDNPAFSKTLLERIIEAERRALQRRFPA